MPTALYIVSIIFFIIYARLILFYRHGWKHFPEFKNNSVHTVSNTKISVIIAARNEEKNISACINSILVQDYPAALFEIIVVDDHSTDNTVSIVNSFAANNIKLISLKQVVGDELLNSYKKKAIETAVQQASGMLIVTTDADCIAGKKWLRTISDFYQLHQAAFIAGPVAYCNEKSSLDIFESLDFMTMQGITAASVRKRFHTMCNGANLAYEKQAFLEVDGFKKIDAIASGDDMLLMHKIYERYPDKVFYLKSKDAIVQTPPTGNIAAFFNQRIRWASKADKYTDKRIFRVLFMVYFFNLWLLILFFFGIMNLKFGILLISLLVAKTILELFFLIPVSKFFGKQKLLWLFPFAQPFHIIYIIVAGWLGKFGSYQWKDRKVK